MGKFKGLFAAFLSMTLWMSQTKGMDAEAVIMEKGKVSPFEGILVPEEQYRLMSIDAFSKSQFEQALNNCEEDKVEYRQNEQGQLIWFIAGLTLGSIVMLSVRR